MKALLFTFLMMLWFDATIKAQTIINVSFQGMVTYSNGTPASGIPVLVSPDAGITFVSAGLSDASGYYSGTFSMTNATYVFTQINSCTGAFVTHMVYWNGIDTSIFFPPLIYCNAATDPYTICINAYVTDTNSLNQNTYAIYLIKSATTINGDSLYLAATDTIGTNEFACFDSVIGTSYAKAMMLPGSSDYGNYLPTYHFTSLFWNNATAMNSNSMPYQNIHMHQGNYTGGPGFIGGYVVQGANRLDEAAEIEAVGDPVAGADVILMNQQNQGVKHTQSGPDGSYSFNNLSYGTYKICVDMLNKPCQSPYVVTLSPDNTTVTNASFSVNATNVSALYSSVTTTNTSEIIYSILSNPVRENLTLTASRPTSSDVWIDIFDVTGRVVHKTQVNSFTIYNLPLHQLHAGSYTLQIETEGQRKFLRFVKI